MKRKKYKNPSAFLLPVLLMLFFSGCEKRKGITIGFRSAGDTALVTELYAQTLESAGYRVNRKYDGGDANTLREALLREELDLYVEYSGSITNDSSELLLLAPVRANYAWGFGMLEENADKKGIRDISDLHDKAGDLILASTEDFMEDPLGFPLLNSSYGTFQFKNIAVVNEDELHMPFHMGKVDVIPLRSVDGHLANPKHKLLTDDLHASAPQSLIPVVNKRYLDQNAQVRTILDSVSKTLVDVEMIALNFKVAGQGIPPPTAAREYLKETGFLKRFK